MKTLIAILGVIGSFVLFVVVSFVSSYNYAIEAERGIVAQYDDMQSILGQYTIKISEMAQVPEMKTDDLSRIVDEAMRGRYGDNGSRGVFQWIQENYPGQVTDDLYIQIQQVMEADRNKFSNSQKQMIDKRELYNTNLGYLWRGFLLKVAGYPKIDMTKFAIISSEHAKEAFDKKIDKPVILRKNSNTE